MKKRVIIRHHNVIHYLSVIGVYGLKGLLSSVAWFAVAGSGYLVFQMKITPYDIIIGLPLMLVGFGFIGNNMQSVFLSIFSPGYNRGVCYFCNDRVRQDGE